MKTREELKLDKEKLKQEEILEMRRSTIAWAK
jgi:hypothetical protein